MGMSPLLIKLMQILATFITYCVLIKGSNIPSALCWSYCIWNTEFTSRCLMIVHWIISVGLQTKGQMNTCIEIKRQTYCLLNFKDVVGNLQFTKSDQMIPRKAFWCEVRVKLEQGWIRIRMRLKWAWSEAGMCLGWYWDEHRLSFGQV